MVKRLFCFLWGHKFWGWEPMRHPPLHLSQVERVEYDNCARCDHERRPQRRSET